MLGTSYNVDKEVCGLHCFEWVRLVFDCYTFSEMGVIFNGYPDGQPLIEQEQTAINIFGIVFNEIMKERSNG